MNKHSSRDDFKSECETRRDSCDTVSNVNSPSVLKSKRNVNPKGNSKRSVVPSIKSRSNVNRSSDFSEIPRRSILTYGGLNRQASRIVNKLTDDVGLDTNLTRNIYTYARQLPLLGSISIDRNIFMAQLRDHFNLTNQLMLERMYHLACQNKSKDLGEECTVSIENFARMICLFVSDNQDMRTRYVFRVYNIRGDGSMSKADMHYLLRYVSVPSATVTPLGDEYQGTTDEDIADLVENLLKVTDTNGDREIDLGEFRNLVKHDSLTLQCLGPCLPDTEYSSRFKNQIKDLRTEDVTEMFKDERRKSLQSCQSVSSENMTVTGIQKFYPVKLPL